MYPVNLFYNLFFYDDIQLRCRVLGNFPHQDFDLKILVPLPQGRMREERGIQPAAIPRSCFILRVRSQNSTPLCFDCLDIQIYLFTFLFASRFSFRKFTPNMTLRTQDTREKSNYDKLLSSFYRCYITGISTRGPHASGFTGLLIPILKILKIPCHVLRLTSGYI